MAKGKRYEGEPKLNIKKVIGVLIALAVLIMIITSIAKILKTNNEEDSITSVTYFSSYNNGKWGVINDSGDEIIKAQYDEMVVVPNKKRAVFVCTYDINEQTGEYKTKAINEKNEEILTGYDKIEAIDNYDSKQNIWFEENLLKIQKNGKYGLITLDGNTVLDSKYDSINTLRGIPEILVVEKDGKVGLVNSKGQKIIEVNYKEITSLEEGYKDAYLTKDENGLYGVVSTTGSTILENKYTEIKYLSSQEAYSVKENDALELVDSKGNVLQTSDGKEYVFVKGENVIVKKDNKYGVETLQGESVIPCDYEELKYASSNYYIAKKEGKFGIINKNNEPVKDFVYISMYYLEKGNFIVADKTETETEILDSSLEVKISGIISEINTDKGYIKIYSENEYKYYNFKFEKKDNTEFLTQSTLFLSKKDNKYGYVDKNGKVVVDYIYDDGTEQNGYGYVAVKKDGLWGSLKKNGVVALEPSVNLDESIYVDFIGAWHLSDDGLYYIK